MTDKFNYKSLKDVIGIDFPHWNAEPSPVQGVGKDHIPIINMDKLIPITQELKENLHEEVCMGMAKSKILSLASFPGSLSTEDPLHKMGLVNWTGMFTDLEKYDPDGRHVKNILKLKDETPLNRSETAYRYAYFAMGALIPWAFTLYIRKALPRYKTTKGTWTEDSEHFPLLKNFLSSLPFKTIGRVLFFATYPYMNVPAHRDYMPVPHKDHSVNFFFSAGWRPSFILDNSTKIYLEKGATSYFFNNRDFHGADLDPTFRYTLRVDGQFNDELCEKLGLVDGWVWNPEVYS